MENILFLIMTFVFVSVLGQKHQLPYIEFHRDPSCTDLIDIRNDTDLRIGSIPELSNAIAVKINGLWRVHLRNLNDDSRSELNTGLWEDQCILAVFPYSLFSAIERFSPRDSNIPEIAFYTENIFNGPKFASVENETELELPRVIMALSYHVSGQSWTAYSDKNFTGTKTCLKSNITDFQMGYSMRSKIIVGSVKIGCEGEGQNDNAGANNKFSIICIILAMFSKSVM